MDSPVAVVGSHTISLWRKVGCGVIQMSSTERSPVALKHGRPREQNTMPVRMLTLAHPFVGQTPHSNRPSNLYRSTNGRALPCRESWNLATGGPSAASL